MKPAATAKSARNPENVEAYYKDQKTQFSGTVKHALQLSNAIGTQYTDRRRGVATWLFMRACVTAKTIESLFVPISHGYGTTFYLDHASIASLSRSLIENIAVLLYVGDSSVNEDEWNCRWQVIELHDARNRSEFLSLIGHVVEERKQRRIITTLTDRLKANPFFHDIPQNRQKRLLDGEDMYVDGRRHAFEKFGWGTDLTKGVYKYLSMHSHTMPMAFHRTEFNKVYEPDSPSAKVTSAFSIEFGRNALGVGCIRMFSLFPRSEDSFDPAIVIGLKQRYSERNAALQD